MYIYDHVSVSDHLWYLNCDTRTADKTFTMPGGAGGTGFIRVRLLQVEKGITFENMYDPYIAINVKEAIDTPGECHALSSKDSWQAIFWTILPWLEFDVLRLSEWVSGIHFMYITVCVWKGCQDSLRILESWYNMYCNIQLVCASVRL